MPRTAKTSLAQFLVIVCPFILFAYPAAALFFATSEFPAFLQRYSYGAAAFNVATILLYTSFAISLFRRALLVASLATMALILLSYAVPASNYVLALPGTMPVLAAARLAASVSLIGIAFLGYRSGNRKATALALAAGACFLIPSAIDTAFLVSGDFRKSDATTSVSYRPNYDLSRLTERDIVIVGDSFVWGQGVEIDQRFGDVLQAKRRQTDPQMTVYSLGIIGVGLRDYTKSVKEVPLHTPVRRMIVAYYQNDMPQMDTFDGWMQKLSLAVGKTSVSARLLLDAVRVSFAPNVDQYLKLLIDNYEEKGTDFPVRWRRLLDDFRLLFELASERSLEKPILVIIPALSTVDREKWAAIHQRLAHAAKDTGFEVVDLFADFRVGTPDALRYRLTINDLHFNVDGNRIVATRLNQTLDE